MEQPHALLDEHDAELLGGVEDSLVVLAAGGSGDVGGARALSTEDVVCKGEL